jgi:small redox-active disulfide protein 2
MMIIKVLGTGCPKCKILQATVESAIQQLWLDASVQKVTDMNDIMQYDIMALPGLVINEKVVMTGKVPSMEELVKLLQDIN